MHWYPKYTSDFIGATLDLSYLEKVSYGWMLDVYYERRAPLPLDSTRLFRLLGCESDEQKQAVKTVLNLFFVKKEDGWYNEKAEDVIKKQAQRSDLATYAIKTRWARFADKKANEINETNDTDVLRTNYERNTDVILSRTRTRTRTKSSSNTNTKSKPNTLAQKSDFERPRKLENGFFEQFWQSYPLKVGKLAAQKKFAKLTMSSELLEIIISQLNQAKSNPQWQKDDGQFIPHPATWLNQRRWEDETTIDMEFKTAEQITQEKSKAEFLKLLQDRELP